MADLKALALKARGLAPMSVMAKARPGAVYLVEDIAIRFPKEELPSSGPRSIHHARRVIVLQEFKLNTAATPPTILVIPCSASATRCDGWDYQIPDGETGFDAKGVVAYVSLIQPILKSRLIEHKGDVCISTFTALRKVALAVLGISSLTGLDVPPVA